MNTFDKHWTLYVVLCDSDSILVTLGTVGEQVNTFDEHWTLYVVLCDSDTILVTFGTVGELSEHI